MSTHVYVLHQESFPWEDLFKFIKIWIHLSNYITSESSFNLGWKFTLKSDIEIWPLLHSKGSITSNGSFLTVEPGSRSYTWPHQTHVRLRKLHWDSCPGLMRPNTVEIASTDVPPYSSVTEQLVCFHYLVFINKTTLNVYEHNIYVT